MAVPRQSYGKLFWRFLRFGCLAWGGPGAQIAMIRQELVEEEKWISREHFNRALAVYQVLPGPEAHELCVYFGMLSRGRLGGFLAGLGFMLPGFLLMFALSWFYVRFGIGSPLFAALFFGCQAAVGALLLRAIHRIGAHALTDRWLWGVALLSGMTQLLGVHFLLILLVAGTAYLCFERKWPVVAVVLGIVFLIGAAIFSQQTLGREMPAVPREGFSLARPSLPTLLGTGLRSGLLTFGGAYTVIPFLRHDAVEVGRWMTDAQFLSGIALSGILPAPFIIFSTFVGYLGGGPLGALLLTLGIFSPAFAFTLVGHDIIERLIARKTLHAFLDGVTAGVVGLIAVTTLGLLWEALTTLPSLGIFFSSLFVLYRWKAKGAVAVAMISSGILGLLFFH